MAGHAKYLRAKMTRQIESDRDYDARNGTIAATMASLTRTTSGTTSAVLFLYCHCWFSLDSEAEPTVTEFAQHRET
eukprot:13148660-Heterocapsa_arctica.AAC.1